MPAMILMLDTLRSARWSLNCCNSLATKSSLHKKPYSSLTISFTS